MLIQEPGVSVQPRGESLSSDSLLFLCHNGKLLLKPTENGLFLPTFKEVQPFLPSDFAPFELSHWQNHTIFSFQPWETRLLPQGENLTTESFSVFRRMDYEHGSLVTSCIHLWNWYACHRFCGCCGAPTQPSRVLRSLLCPQCGHEFFPVIAPAVIVAITCGDQILLAQNAQVKTRRPSLIAGYVEVGETLEHAVRREALEEVGLPLQDLHYLGDQPWGVSGSHMFAFHAHGDNRLPLCLQQEELSWAGWVSRRELEEEKEIISIAGVLKEKFRQGELQ